MFSSCKYMFLCIFPILNFPQSCTSEPVFPPMLVLYSPGDAEYTDVLVKREHDNLTLVCELRGDAAPRSYVWNYVNNGTMDQSSYTVEPVGPTTSSKLMKQDLQLSDSGQYMCSAPPFSVTKYVLVQTKGGAQCARGAFWCGARCVLPGYVCDGRADCARAEDEAPELCNTHVCARSDKLNCSSGRCISASACCRGSMPLCRQPACCDEFPLTRLPGFADEYPPLFEDRHAPDDYGFIQSTIYTVTACALIFMIAVVLLVSAICKMHMKRAALRGYTHADRATRQHYTMQYAQAHRFPPCYEASRLLEENRTASPQQSPVHVTTTPELQCAPESPSEVPRGLARLSSIFSSRYRQVPTQPEPVEMQNVRSTSLNSSPTRNRPLHNYRSPTYCDLNTEFLFTDPETPDLGRDLNYMATPIEFFRRRTMRRNTLERVMDQLDRQRLTLQLGRFQLSIPRFGRPDPRPDTPNVAEINIDDLDFVRLNSNDTYTLNGRTIRLLGANFENYPVMPDGSVRPPSYTEAVRYKLYGPPPEYLSREGLNRRSADTVDREATSNIEMPPCYEDLNAVNHVNNDNITVIGFVDDHNNVINGLNNIVHGSNNVFNGDNSVITGDDNVITGNSDTINGNNNVINQNNDVVNGNNDVVTGNKNFVTGNNDVVTGNNNLVTGNNDVVNGDNKVVNGDNKVVNRNNVDISEDNRLNTATNAMDFAGSIAIHIDSNVNLTHNDECHVETLSSIIDNLPAIDSDDNVNGNLVNDLDSVNSVNLNTANNNITNPVNSVGNNVAGNATINVVTNSGNSVNDSDSVNSVNLNTANNNITNPVNSVGNNATINVVKNSVNNNVIRNND